MEDENRIEETDHVRKSESFQTQDASPKPREAIKCPVCGNGNDPSAELCAYCGQRLKPWSPRPVRTSPTSGDSPSYASMPQEGLAGNEPVEQELLEGRPELADNLTGDESHLKSAGSLADSSKDSAYPSRPARDAGSSQPLSSGMHPSEVRYYFGPVPFADRVFSPSHPALRASAFFIDAVIITLLSTLLVSLFGMQGTIAEFQQKQMELGILNSAGMQETYPHLVAQVVRFFYVVFALAVGYFGIFNGIGGQTIGKAVAGVRLLKRDGSELGFLLSLLRSLVMWSLIHFTVGAYFIIAMLTMLFDREGRAPHDFLFGTSVYRVR